MIVFTMQHYNLNPIHIIEIGYNLETIEQYLIFQQLQYLAISILSLYGLLKAWVY